MATFLLPFLSSFEKPSAIQQRAIIPCIQGKYAPPWGLGGGGVGPLPFTSYAVGWGAPGRLFINVVWLWMM